MVINISDVYSNHRINQLCDPMCDYMKQKTDAEFVGTMGLRMNKRPRSKAQDIEGVFAEPIFVWRKLY